MGWITTAVCAVPVYLLYSKGHPWLGTVALVAFLVEFWSFGVMHNFAYTARREREGLLRQALSEDSPLTARDEEMISARAARDSTAAVPDGLSTVNMLSTVACIALLVYALIWA